MKNFLIVAKADRLTEYCEIAKKYGVGFELNDFYMPEVLCDEKIQQEIIEKYHENGIPDYCTMHGAFFDVIVFSYDKEIAEISRKRMLQSMETAKRAGVKAVVFHTNANPFLSFKEYESRTVEYTVKFMKELLEQYPNINIYLENMFDGTPDILREISEQLKSYANYGVCLDYAHASISDTPVEVWIDELKEYIKHVHINDNDLVNDLHLAVGEGKIDWNVFKKYYEQFFRKCTVLIETLTPENQEKSIKFLDRLLNDKDEETNSRMEVKRMIDECKCSKLDAEEMLEKIFYYMTRLLGVKEFSTTVDLLTNLGSTIVNAERASFWFWDKTARQYWTLSALGNSRITIPENTGIVGRAIKTNRVALCNNPYSDADFNSSVDKQTGYITKSILCIPVTNIDDEVIGAFQVINKIGADSETGKFDDKDVKRLSIVAAFCEKSLESYLLYNEASLDQLTGLKNRYAFYEYFNKKIMPQLGKSPVSLIMCDIDHFKKVNDTYGHNVGDVVLKGVAEIFISNLAKGDEVVRWGGEEFIFILRDADTEKARINAEKLRREIENTEFETEGQKLNITMSFGVSEIDCQKNLEENVKLVDDRLYRAKRTGRNKVV